MANIIKLENINEDKQTHKEKYVEEYVCSNCRHLVEPNDKTCWQCGEKLEPSEKVERYRRGEKPTDEEFDKATKALSDPKARAERVEG